MNSPNGRMVGIGSDPNYDPSRGGYASSGTDLVEIGQKGMKFLADGFAGLQVRLNFSSSSLLSVLPLLVIMNFIHIDILNTL